MYEEDSHQNGAAAYCEACQESEAMTLIVLAGGWSTGLLGGSNTRVGKFLNSDINLGDRKTATVVPFFRMTHLFNIERINV